MVSQRALQILNILKNSLDQPITAKKIAAILEISERSVRTYIKEVNEFCKTNNIELINKQGMGLHMKPTHSQQKRLDEYLSNVPPYFSAESRLWYIIRLLLNNWTYYTIALFADDLYVSPNTISNDLKAAEKWFNNFDIKVIKKSGIGVWLEGDEFDIRRAIVSANRGAYKYKSTDKAHDIPDYRLNQQSANRLLYIYKMKDLKSFSSRVIKAEKIIGYELTEIGFETLLEYLIVQQMRIRLGCFLNEDSTRKNFNCGDKIQLAAKSISHELKEETNEIIPDSELEFICLLFVCSDYQYNSEQCEFIYTNASANIIDLANQILEYVSELLGISLTNSITLEQNIVAFLNSSIPRVNFGIELENLLLHEVKKAYPVEFSACYAAAKFYRKFCVNNPSENEISYLAMLIGTYVASYGKKVTAVVVCASGEGTAHFVMQRITREISEIEIVKTLPFSSLDEIEKYNPDLIISTVTAFKHEKPVVYVKPLLNMDDISNIRKACDSLDEAKHSSSNKLTIKNLLNKNIMWIKHGFINKDELIQSVASKMYQEGFVKEDFLQSVINREQIGSTVLGKGIAMPHSTSNAVNSPAVGLVTLQESIDWNGEPVDIIFVLALNFEDITTTQAFFKSLYLLIQDDMMLKRIRDAKTADDLLNIF